MTVNGKPFDLANLSQANVSALLIYMEIEPMVAVELNGEVLDRENFSSTLLTDQDTIEIIRFVGGG